MSSSICHTCTTPPSVTTKLVSFFIPIPHNQLPNFANKFIRFSIGSHQLYLISTLNKWYAICILNDLKINPITKVKAMQNSIRNSIWQAILFRVGNSGAALCITDPVGGFASRLCKYVGSFALICLNYTFKRMFSCISIVSFFCMLAEKLSFYFFVA